MLHICCILLKTSSDQVLLLEAKYFLTCTRQLDRCWRKYTKGSGKGLCFHRTDMISLGPRSSVATHGWDMLTVEHAAAHFNPVPLLLSNLFQATVPISLPRNSLRDYAPRWLPLFFFDHVRWKMLIPEVRPKCRLFGFAVASADSKQPSCCPYFGKLWKPSQNWEHLAKSLPNLPNCGGLLLGCIEANIRFGIFFKFYKICALLLRLVFVKFQISANIYKILSTFEKSI